MQHEKITFDETIEWQCRQNGGQCQQNKKEDVSS